MNMYTLLASRLRRRASKRAVWTGLNCAVNVRLDRTSQAPPATARQAMPVIPAHSRSQLSFQTPDPVAFEPVTVHRGQSCTWEVKLTAFFFFFFQCPGDAEVRSRSSNWSFISSLSVCLRLIQSSILTVCLDGIQPSFLRPSSVSLAVDTIAQGDIRETVLVHSGHTTKTSLFSALCHHVYKKCLHYYMVPYRHSCTVSKAYHFKDFQSSCQVCCQCTVKCWTLVFVFRTF